MGVPLYDTITTSPRLDPPLTSMPDSHFFLHHHPRQESLAELLVQKLQGESFGNPFHQSNVLVRNQGMATWIQQQLARRTGLAMQVNFPQPNRLLQDILNAPGIDPEELKWQIFQQLPGLCKHKEFQAIRKYLDPDTSLLSPALKRYQLAGVLAGLFDKYLLYRPDWIARWQQGKSAGLSGHPSDELWQRLLWQSVAPATDQHWAQILLGDQPLPAPSIQSLHVFGITNFAPSYIRFLNKLSAHIPVHVYWMNPVEKDGGYWEDAASRKDWLLAKEFDDPEVLQHNNPLLSCFGRLGREYIHTLYGGSLEDIHIQEEEHSLPPACPPLPKNQLQQLQAGLYQNSTTPSPPTPDSDDTSISIHACHSPLRELETLKTHLLRLAEQSPLDPGDVLVMCPDIQTYAPAVEAVFAKQHNQNLPPLPFSIGDYGQADADPSITALLSLFSLHHSRFTNQQALSLLATPAIRDHFELSEDDLPVIKDWIQQNGIRWGFNQQHIQQTTPGCPESSWSWQNGIDRMLLGYAMPNPPTANSPVLWNDMVPFHHIEGTNTRILDALCNFLGWCRKIRLNLGSDRTLTEWVQQTRDWLDSGTSKSDIHQRTLRPIDTALETLLQQADAVNEPVPAEVLLEHLTQTLRSTPAQSRFLSGAVTFCEMKPMRAIPARIICLLGMNHDAFPRPDNETAFDLTRLDRRIGDRSSRDDDTYAFLEALLSAREHLYISYLGTSIKDGKPRPPSTALQTLLDQLPGLSVQHEKLHNFDPSYFTPSGTISHDPQLLDCARLLLSPNAGTHPVCQIHINNPSPPEQTSLEHFVKTITHPTQQFLRHSLQAHNSYLDTPLDPDEPISIHGLDAYTIKQNILNNKQLNEDHITAWKQTGMLPPGGLTSQDAFQPIAEIAANIPPTRALKININIQAGDHPLNISGNVAVSTASEQAVIITTTPSEAKPKTMLATWLHLLAASVELKQEVRAELHGIKDLKPSVRYFSPPDDARAILEDLAALYQTAQQSPLPHFPQSAHAYVTTPQGNNDHEQYEAKRRKNARTKWFGSDFSYGAESEDPANACFFEADGLFNDSELTEAFIQIAKRIWQPLEQHISDTPPENA